MKVRFLKSGYYRNKKYEKDTIINMSELDVKAYLECKVVKQEIPNKKKNKVIDYNKMSYKEIQQICKKKGLQAVGKKEELIESLKG